MLAQTEVAQIISQQREYFGSGKTKEIDFRINQLKLS